MTTQDLWDFPLNLSAKSLAMRKNRRIIYGNCVDAVRNCSETDCEFPLLVPIQYEIALDDIRPAFARMKIAGYTASISVQSNCIEISSDSLTGSTDCGTTIDETDGLEPFPAELHSDVLLRKIKEQIYTGCLRLLSEADIDTDFPLHLDYSTRAIDESSIESIAVKMTDGDYTVSVLPIDADHGQIVIALMPEIPEATKLPIPPSFSSADVIVDIPIITKKATHLPPMKNISRKKVYKKSKKTTAPLLPPNSSKWTSLPTCQFVYSRSKDKKCPEMIEITYGKWMKYCKKHRGYVNRQKS